MNAFNRRTLGTLAVVTAAACSAGAPGPAATDPRQRQMEEHDQATKRHEGAEIEHAARFDPTQNAEMRPCTSARDGICWESVANPTAEHAREAERHRRAAAEHRAASRALVTAEERSCSGITESERDTSPFYHRRDIANVEPVFAAHAPTPRIVGARVMFRAVPGLSVEWLQQVIDCHLARNAALGYRMPEMAYCPLVLKGVSARVTPARGGGFAVSIVAEGENTAGEVWRRAQSLVTR